MQEPKDPLGSQLMLGNGAIEGGMNRISLVIRSVFYLISSESFSSWLFLVPAAKPLERVLLLAVELAANELNDPSFRGRCVELF